MAFDEETEVVPVPYKDADGNPLPLNESETVAMKKVVDQSARIGDTIPLRKKLREAESLGIVAPEDARNFVKGLAKQKP